MKKITTLLSALLIAIAAMAFTACATDHTSDEPAGPSLTGWYIDGTFNGWTGTALTASGTAYTAELTASSDSHEFAVHNSGWASKYCAGATIPAGVKTAVKAGGSNATVTGLTSGTTYTVTVVSGPACVYVTITPKVSN